MVKTCAGTETTQDPDIGTLESLEVETDLLDPQRDPTPTAGIGPTPESGGIIRDESALRARTCPDPNLGRARLPGAFMSPSVTGEFDDPDMSIHAGRGKRTQNSRGEQDQWRKVEPRARRTSVSSVASNRSFINLVDKYGRPKDGKGIVSRASSPDATPRKIIPTRNKFDVLSVEGDNDIEANTTFIADNEPILEIGESSKGKGVDPLNWGNINISQKEIDSQDELI
jgi:hypothetical protein